MRDEEAEMGRERRQGFETVVETQMDDQAEGRETWVFTGKRQEFHSEGGDRWVVRQGGAINNHRGNLGS